MTREELISHIGDIEWEDFEVKEAKGSKVHSSPRNPIIIKLFRYPKLAENAGYGIDKIYEWEKLTGFNVEFYSDLMYSETTYFKTVSNQKTYIIPNSEDFSQKLNKIFKQWEEQWGAKIIERRKEILLKISENPEITTVELSEAINLSSTSVDKHLRALKDAGILEHRGATKNGTWVILL